MPQIRDEPGPRYASLLQLLQTADTIWNASRLFFAQWDLSPSQFNILNLLNREGPGLTQIELSRELIMHRSNVTGLVDRLEQRKLVERKASQQDRRIWTIVLTGEGRKLTRQILPAYYKIIEELWGDTPPKKAAAIAREMEHLRTQAILITDRFSES